MSEAVAETAEARVQRRRQRVRGVFRSVGMLPVLVVLGLLIWGLEVYLTGEGRFVTWQNLSIVLQQASVNAVLAAGMTFVILTGGIDLSVGSILAASAMAALIVSLTAGDLGIVAGLAMGLAMGLGNGALIAFLRLPPFIVTLGTLTAAMTRRCSTRRCRSRGSATGRCMCRGGWRSRGW